MIKVLNVDWLLAGENNFADFCNSLQCCNSQRIFEYELVSVLVNANWEVNQWIIIKYCFLPWMIYVFCAIFSFQEFLVSDEVTKFEQVEQESEFSTVRKIYRVSLIFLTTLFICAQLLVECI